MTDTATRAINSMVKSQLMLDEPIAPIIRAIDAAVLSHAQFIDESDDTPIPLEHIEAGIAACDELRATLETLR